MPKTTVDPSQNPGPHTRITPKSLPAPTYIPQDPTKKTHARKQPAGHVPRPRNAFILFRCDFVRQGKVPPDVENDHRNISRIAGRVWREMTTGEREPWVKMAEEEKRVHSRVHPGYRYTPHLTQLQGVKKKKAAIEEDVGEIKKAMETKMVRRTSSCPDLPETQLLPRDDCERKAAVQRMPYLSSSIPSTTAQNRQDNQAARTKTAMPYDFEHPYLQSWTPEIISPIQKRNIDMTANMSTGSSPPTPPFLSFRRPSSCPPGAQRVSSAHLTHPSATSALQMTRDDLARRPSRIPMYQSSPTALVFPVSGSNNWDNSLGLLYPNSPYVRDLGKNMRPPLLNGPYRIDPPHDAPGWDASPPLPQPQLQVYPWMWDWSSDEAGMPKTTYDYTHLPQDVYGEVTKRDLEGISRVGLEGISPVDVGTMIYVQESGNASSFPPVFTNPFASAHTSATTDGSTFTDSYDLAGKIPASGFGVRDPGPLELRRTPFGDGDGDNDFGSGRDQPSRNEAPVHFLAPEEALVRELFPRMSLDDRTYDQSIADTTKDHPWEPKM